MSNSRLVTYTNLSPNKTTIRNKKNDTITIHCYVGQVTAKRGCDGFSNPDRQASSNYVVGYDGSIGLCVDEKDRAWTSGGKLRVNGETGAMNDKHAVTIEVACETTHPYAVTPAAYEALIKLVADIAKRNNMGELKWKGDKNLVGRPDLQNMTVHRWFANKACPGDYLYERMGDIAARANAINHVNKETDEEMTQEKFNQMMSEWLKQQSKRPASNYQEDGLVWGQANGLMVGDETGNLMAQRFITRGEFITVLKRFFDKFIKK